MAAKPTVIVIGKPTENKFICGAARVIIPMMRLTVNIAANAGNAIDRAPVKMTPPQRTNIHTASAPKASPTGKSVKLECKSRNTECK